MRPELQAQPQNIAGPVQPAPGVDSLGRIHCVCKILRKSAKLHPVCAKIAVLVRLSSTCLPQPHLFMCDPVPTTTAEHTAAVTEEQTRWQCKSYRQGPEACSGARQWARPGWHGSCVAGLEHYSYRRCRRSAAP